MKTVTPIIERSGINGGTKLEVRNNSANFG